MIGCQPEAPPFWLAAAAIVLIFSFFGFLVSRLPFCSPLAMSLSYRWMVNRFDCLGLVPYRDGLLHCFVVCRALDRFVDLAAQFILADSMKAFCQLRGLLCVHRQRFEIVIRKFYSPDTVTASVRLDQHNGLVQQSVIEQQRMQWGHQGIASNSEGSCPARKNTVG